MSDFSNDLVSDAYALTNRILKIKMRMLSDHPFFGLLAQHVELCIDPDVNTACTDGEKIYFGQEFSKSIDNEQLYFVFFHELMHIVYKHCFRSENLNNHLYNIAADIVINSAILDELNLDDIYIHGSALMHKTPDEEEGRNYTAEEVYAMLCDEIDKNGSLDNLISANDANNDYGGNSNGSRGSKNDNNSKNGRNSYSKSTNDLNDDSNNFDDMSGGGSSFDESELDDFFFDDHSRWCESESNELNEAKWQQRIFDTVKVLESSKGYGSVPSLAKRMVEEIKNPPIDWRAVLNNFIQSDVYDYSFAPPDRRYAESGFFLPDFNEREDKIENIWIAVDSSGSVSDKQLALALNEISSAIEQYNGKFSGWISFFDYYVTKPQAFDGLDDIKRLNLYGGGGTSFVNIFKAKKEYFEEELSCIIIITDGYAPWPKEEEADGVPVLWLFNNLKVTPPWGIVARMNIKERN